MEQSRSNIQAINTRIEELQAQQQKEQIEFNRLTADLATAQKTAENLQDESTQELQQNIAEVDEINRRVRANLDKDKAEEDANEYKNQYDTLTNDITSIREEKAALLANAQLPLPGLSVTDGELIYNGQKWDNMSGSDQLKVSTAIVRKLKPDCGFILLDKLEQMDMVTLNEFGHWLEQEGLQAIATRVSTGDECEIIIEDGYVTENRLVLSEGGPTPQQSPQQPKWKEGEF